MYANIPTCSHTVFQDTIGRKCTLRNLLTLSRKLLNIGWITWNTWLTCWSDCVFSYAIRIPTPSIFHPNLIFRLTVWPKIAPFLLPTRPVEASFPSPGAQYPRNSHLLAAAPFPLFENERHAQNLGDRHVILVA